MNFSAIFGAKFGAENCKLWNCRLQGEAQSELLKFRNQLKNHTYVEQFLIDNQHHLSSKELNHFTLESAAAQIYDEFLDLIPALQRVEEEMQKGNINALSNFFVPLSLNEYAVNGRTRVKAKIKGYHPPLLRLYGIPLQENQILITGGGIKLVGEMSECKLLQNELDKLNSVRGHLNDHQILFLD